jgi:hypothetical protein
LSWLLGKCFRPTVAIYSTHTDVMSRPDGMLPPFPHQTHSDNPSSQLPYHVTIGQAWRWKTIDTINRDPRLCPVLRIWLNKLCLTLRCNQRPQIPSRKEPMIPYEGQFLQTFQVRISLRGLLRDNGNKLKMRMPLWFMELLYRIMLDFVRYKDLLKWYWSLSEGERQGIVRVIDDQHGGLDR